MLVLGLYCGGVESVGEGKLPAECWCNEKVLLGGHC